MPPRSLSLWLVLKCKLDVMRLCPYLGAVLGQVPDQLIRQLADEQPKTPVRLQRVAHFGDAPGHVHHKGLRDADADKLL